MENERRSREDQDDQREREAPSPRPDDDAWIEKVVDVAGSLGFNKMRLRWKLIRWQESRRRSRRRREQQIAHIRYEHKTCPECGAIHDRSEARCTRCGAKLTSRAMQVLQRIGLTTPEFLSMSTMLALVLLGVYLRVWIAAGGGLGSPKSLLLIDFGGRLPTSLSDEPWRLVTAIFLHAGLWHLGFNLLAIATIGPRIEQVYGRLTMLMLFVVTGTLANAGTLAISGLAASAHGVGIGASGGVMGLIGAAAGYGQRLGTSGGRLVRNDMLKWSAYTFVFGYWVGADNWAHGFGFVAGAAFGYAVRPSVWTHPQLLPVRTLGKLIGAVGAIGALVIIFTRTPSPREASRPPDEDRAGNGLAQLAVICRHYDSGDRAGARAAATAMLRGTQVNDASEANDASEVNDASVEGMCAGLYEQRERCRTGNFDPALGNDRLNDTLRESQRQLCETYGAMLSKLPERAPRPAAHGSTDAPPAERGSADRGSADRGSAER